VRSQGGNDEKRDRTAIAAYLGGSGVFDKAIARFASVYADQSERDHKALVDAVPSGRLTAEPGLQDPGRPTASGAERNDEYPA
jgi:Uncharacterized protein conserved in bacteria (DUF2252)